jgi:exodeoxyribonuclease VII large subunit
VRLLLDRARRQIIARLDNEQHRLDGLRSRPALADPHGVLTTWATDVAATRERGRRAALVCVAEAHTAVARLAARVTALSPQATLDRGYAVVQRDDGVVVRDAGEVQPGEQLIGRFASGRLSLLVAEGTSR